MKKNHFGNILVIATTFILFAIALFTTGLTKDLLLESGILLVSIKIIIMSHRTANSNMEIIKKLNEINEKLKNPKGI
ncbi:MAG: hypothetical protein CVU10_02770 [Bacteroidetes bacterium HGW-Bacteroidetes-5]|jgi:hypothetical protein|nr:MAG: hypothetical protein CVU10_02770 [Bacteroidetes bacterium HGW-Bacteroidetes-5]